MNIQDITVFFGWCTVINFGILIFSAMYLFAFGEFAARIHKRMFKIEPKNLLVLYFNYLAYYKVGILIFNLTPYVALKIMER